ncbi:MAG TPA: ABC transporter permease [Terriglobales bacterium]|nr:ABC transporter permease [Terriglobales bacterium]
MPTRDRLRQELQSHLDLRIAELIADGVDAESARRIAAVEFGGMAGVEQECRDARRWHRLADFLADTRFALRSLRRSPGFALVAVLLLGLGIGANTVIFSLVQATLLRPLPYANDSRLVWLTEVDGQGADQSFSIPDFRDFQADRTVFSSMGGYRDLSLTITAAGRDAQQVPTRITMPETFETLGVAPARGRLFSAREQQANGPPVVIISDRFWHSYFGAEAGVVGQALPTSRGPLTVVGVMPPGFVFGPKVDLWAPYPQYVPALYLQDRADSFILYGVARLKPGVSLAAAGNAVSALSHNLAAEYPKSNATVRAKMMTLREQLTGNISASLWMVFGAVNLVLLIVCANLANLLLVRAAAREQEMAVRIAIGAGRGRIARQLFAEGLLLAMLGGGAGLVCAVAALPALTAALPANFPVLGPLTLNRPVLAFSFAVAAAAGLAFSLIPLVFNFREQLYPVLKQGGRHSSNRGLRAHASLVVIEVALAMTLLAGAGLMLRTMQALNRVALGFDSARLVTATVSLSSTAYRPVPARARYFEQLVRQAGALPGVESSAVVFPLPFTTQIAGCFIAIEGRVPAANAPQTSYYATVNATYFQTMRIPLVAGRAFTAADDAMGAPPVVVIDRGLAEKYWHSPAQAVGRRMEMFTQDFGHGTVPPATIVGVVGEVKSEAADKDANLEVYTPLNMANGFMTLVLRMRARPDAEAMAAALHTVFRRLDPSLVVPTPHAMSEIVAQSQSIRQQSMWLLEIFAGAALLLAGLGIYGVLSYMAQLRRREFGIRVALGAEPARLTRGIVAHSVKLTAIGLAIGTGAALVLSRFLATLLYGVTRFDPLTLISVALVLLISAIAASLIPALRASTADPRTALQAE